MTPLNKHELLLTTTKFGFTNNQIAFIKGYLHRKYPIAMSALIDEVRGFMKAVQSATVSELQYGAYLYTSEGSARYHVSESLAYLDAEGRKFYIGIEPIEPEQKGEFRKRTIEQKEDHNQELVALVQKHQASAECVNIGLKLGLILNFLEPIISRHAAELVVHACEFDFTQAKEVCIKIGHKATQSHYIKIHFDLI
jgi:hypothetical protein